VGVYITIFVYFALMVINGFIFYNYMIFVHMNGRILDLYKRLSGIPSDMTPILGSIKSFFLPNDNEVSLKYLQWVVKRAKERNFIIKSENKTITNKQGQLKLIQFVHIYKYGNHITLSAYREQSNH